MRYLGHAVLIDRCRRALLTLSVATVMLGGMPVQAEDDPAAEAAVDQGVVASPAALFERVAADFGGRVLTLDLERDDENGPWRYEVKLLMPDGRVIRAGYDAKSLQMIGARGDEDRPSEGAGATGRGAGESGGGRGASGNAGSGDRGRSSAGPPD